MKDYSMIVGTYLFVSFLTASCGFSGVREASGSSQLAFPTLLEAPSLPQTVAHTTHPTEEEIKYISQVLPPAPSYASNSEFSPYQLIGNRFNRKAKGQAIPTVYYTPRFTRADNSCEGLKIPLLNNKGQSLIQVCRTIYSACALQGACAIEGRLFNVTNGTVRLTYFVEITNMGCPYGKGVNMACLDPFHTVAADLNVHKPGDVIYVPKVRGLTLPDGKTHDGYFVVRDRGGAIKGRGRFDFFAGFLSYRDPNNPFAALGLGDKRNRFEYVEVKGEAAKKVLAARNYPRLPQK